MITIDQESTRRSKHPLNLDNMSQRYHTTSNLYTFSSPGLLTLEKNLFYLLRNSKKIQFEQKYNFKPDYLSFDQYGTIILGYLLMYVNSVPSVEDFVLNDIMIPSLDSITKITKDRHLNTKKIINETDTVDW